MTPKNLQQLYRSIPRQMQAIIYAGKAYTSYQNEITEFVWCIWASYWTYLLTAAFLLAKIVYAKPRKKSQTHTVSLTSFLTILRLTIPPMKSKFYDATLPICYNNKKHCGSWEPPGRFSHYYGFLFTLTQSRRAWIKM